MMTLNLSGYSYMEWLLRLVCVAALSLVVQHSNAETIRIGVSAPLTGIQAPSGQDVVSHLKAGMAELTESGAFGAHVVELLVLDDGYVVERTSSNVTNLVNEKKVHLMMSQIGSAHINASLPKLRGTGVTLFAPLAGPSSLYADALRPGVVPLRASYHDEVRAQIKALEAAGISSIAVVYQDDAFGQDIVAAWKAGVAKESNLVITGSFPVQRGSIAVEPIIDNAIASKPSAIIIALVSSPALVATKHLRTKSAGLIYPVLMSVAATSEVIEGLQTGRGSVLFSSVMPLPTGGKSRFIVDYGILRKKYNLRPSFRGLEAYVGLTVVASTLRKMKSVTPTSLGRALSEETTFKAKDLYLRAQEPRFADVFVITRTGIL